MATGLAPLSYVWGLDRGVPILRYYLEAFLREHAADIRGQCLEFQEDCYATRFGGAAVSKLDILHHDHSNPMATIVADLTRPNTIPRDCFDCIICTHVLHVVFDLEEMVAELHRLLRETGVLLVGVPHVSMYAPEAGEYWRFPPEGLRAVLAKAFGAANVMVRGYGNSLTAAGSLRGLVAHEFSEKELNYLDERFPIEVCARAVKRLSPG